MPQYITGPSYFADLSFLNKKVVALCVRRDKFMLYAYVSLSYVLLCYVTLFPPQLYVDSPDKYDDCYCNTNLTQYHNITKHLTSVIAKIASVHHRTFKLYSYI